VSDTLANPAPSAERLHAGFLALLPRIVTHAKIHFRYVRCPGRRDDLIAECIAVSWKWYMRAISTGRNPADFPAVFAFKAASHVRVGRRLCRADSARDVLSPVARRRHNFVIQALPECESGVADNQAIDALADPKTPPPERAGFRIDYPAWLSRLGKRDRLIAQGMALGETTKDLALKYRLSEGRISQMRRELHSDWRRFHGEIE